MVKIPLLDVIRPVDATQAVPASARYPECSADGSAATELMMPPLSVAFP